MTSATFEMLNHRFASESVTLNISFLSLLGVAIVGISGLFAVAAALVRLFSSYTIWKFDQVHELNIRLKLNAAEISERQKG